MGPIRRYSIPRVLQSVFLQVRPGWGTTVNERVCTPTGVVRGWSLQSMFIFDHCLHGYSGTRLPLKPSLLTRRALLCVTLTHCRHVDLSFVVTGVDPLVDVI